MQTSFSIITTWQCRCLAGKREKENEGSRVHKAQTKEATYQPPTPYHDQYHSKVPQQDKIPSSLKTSVMAAFIPSDHQEARKRTASKSNKEGSPGNQDKIWLVNRVNDPWRFNGEVWLANSDLIWWVWPTAGLYAGETFRYWCMIALFLVLSASHL